MQTVFKSLGRTPPWLQRSFERAATEVWGQVITFFPEDVPQPSPKDRFAALCAGYRRATSRDARKSFSDKNLASLLNPDETGCIITNADGGTSWSPFGFSFEARSPSRLPTRALVRLPSPRLSVPTTAFKFLNLPADQCQDFTDVNVPEAIFWHEVGHYRSLQTPVRYHLTPYHDERLADVTTYRMSAAPTRDYFRHLRTLESFLAPIRQDDMMYWHPFSVEIGRRVDPREEIASILEVKRRALGLPSRLRIWAPSPRSAIREALYGWGAENLRKAYDYPGVRGGWDRAHLLRGLQERAGQGNYHFPHAAAFEERVLEAATLLTPGAVGRKVRRAYPFPVSGPAP